MDKRKIYYMRTIKNFIQNMSQYPKQIKIVQVSPTVTEIYYDDISTHNSIKNDKSVFSQMRKTSIEVEKNETIKEKRIRWRKREENNKIIADLKQKSVDYWISHPSKTRPEREQYLQLRKAWHDKISDLGGVR